MNNDVLSGRAADAADRASQSVLGRPAGPDRPDANYPGTNRLSSGRADAGRPGADAAAASPAVAQGSVHGIAQGSVRGLPRADFALCERYFGMSRSLWEATDATLQWMLRDPVARPSLDRIRDRLVCHGDVAAAAGVCRTLRTHASVFAPNRAAADVTLAAAMAHCLPDAIGNMSDRGVPDPVIEATLRDFAVWADVYREKTGREGVWELEWNLLSLTGRILRIGRLQYESTVFAEPCYLFRRHADGGITALTAPGIHELPEGRPQGTNGMHTDGGFTTTLNLNGRELTGNAIDMDRGVALPETVRLNLNDADLLLAPGMPVTNMHVPADGPLTPSAVNDSLNRASALLERLGRRTPVVMCESWLLDPALERFARADGNICRFMRRFRKFPVRAERPMIMDRVFGWDSGSIRLQNLPERTTLQRCLKAYLLNGGTVHDTAGVTLMPDVPQGPRQTR